MVSKLHSTDQNYMEKADLTKEAPNIGPGGHAMRERGEIFL